MKKHIMLLMAIVCMFAMLTGCVQQDIGVAINSDGTGTVSATIGIEEDAYEQLVGMGSDIFEGKETSTYEHDGKTYVSYTETKSYENYEDIENALLEMTYESDVFDGLNTEDFETEDAEESAEAAEPAQAAEDTKAAEKKTAAKKSAKTTTKKTTTKSAKKKADKE